MKTETKFLKMSFFFAKVTKVATYPKFIHSIIMIKHFTQVRLSPSASAGQWIWQKLLESWSVQFRILAYLSSLCSRWKWVIINSKMSYSAYMNLKPKLNPMLEKTSSVRMYSCFWKFQQLKYSVFWRGTLEGNLGSLLKPISLSGNK